MKKLKELKVINKTNSFDLESEYIKALEDKNFKELVSKIDLSNDDLMKYTSKLQISSEENNNCKTCKSLDYCKNEVKGYSLIPEKIDKRLVFNYVACKYKNKELKDRKKNITLNEIPEEIIKANIKNIYLDDVNRKKAIVWMQKFLKNYKLDKINKGLYLHGNFGSGKTYILAATINELYKHNIKGVIVYWPEFLRDLKASFDTFYNEKFELVKRAQVLLIDDIGAENMTQWGRDEVLAPILQYRMDSNLTTFFTSNLGLEDLEIHLSISKSGVDLLKAKRIIERISKLCDILEMNAANLRK